MFIQYRMCIRTSRLISKKVMIHVGMGPWNDLDQLIGCLLPTTLSQTYLGENWSPLLMHYQEMAKHESVQFCSNCRLVQGKRAPILAYLMMNLKTKHTNLSLFTYMGLSLTNQLENRDKKYRGPNFKTAIFDIKVFRCQRSQEHLQILVDWLLFVSNNPVIDVFR